LNSKPCPECNCYGFPSTPTDIYLTRPTTCDWNSGVIVWQNGNYGIPLTLFINPYGNAYQNNPNQNPINQVFQFSGAGLAVTGSCSYNFTTGQTTGTLSCVAEFEPDCTCSPPNPGVPCKLNVTVYFDETLCGS
jgi:hypothetical protein